MARPNIAVISLRERLGRNACLLTLLTMITVAALQVTPGALAVEKGEDGLHKVEWFSLTFRDIAEDIADAEAEGKRLALIFEQRGCIYCDRLHNTVLNLPDVAEYISDNYHMVQYNLYGDEEVIDLDGEAITEKSAAEKWGLMFTPTILFMPDTDEWAALQAESDSPPNAREAAVAMLPGAPGKYTVRHVFEWVKNHGYSGDEPFQRYHARRLQEQGVVE